MTRLLALALRPSCLRLLSQPRRCLRFLIALLGLWAASRATADDTLPQQPPDPFSAAGAAETATPAPPAAESAAAKAFKEEKWGLSIYVDQDSVFPWLAPWGGDQNYTMGVGLQVTGAIVRPLTWPVGRLDALFGLGRVHDRLATETTALLPADVPRSFENHSLMLVNGAFTPRRLELSEPIYDDRPYGSILGLTAAHATIDPYGRRVLRTELTIGMLGLHVSDWVQTRIHTHRRRSNQRRDPSAVTPYDPAGWDNQISDGGEPTGKYTATWLQALSESRPHDLTLHVEGSVGYYTNAAVGFVGRLGWLRSDFWTAQTNPLTAANQGLTTENAKGHSRIPDRDRSGDKLEAYVFAAARARLVVYNELLQGGFRGSPVQLEDADIEHVLREFDAGGTLGWRGLAVTISLTRRSAEYNVGVPRTHTWGGIYITYRKR